MDLDEVQIFKAVVVNTEVNLAVSVAFQVPRNPHDLTDALIVFCRVSSETNY